MGAAAVAAARAVAYQGAGTVEFLLRRPRVLFPRDEHAPAGRASGHRDDHRARSRRVAVARGGGRAAAARAGRRSAATGTRSRRGCTPRTRSAASCRPPAGCAACVFRRRCSTCASTAACSEGDEVTRALRPDDRQGDRLGAGPDRRARPAARGARAGRGRGRAHAMRATSGRSSARMPCARATSARGCSSSRCSRSGRPRAERDRRLAACGGGAAAASRGAPAGTRVRRRLALGHAARDSA